MGFCNLPRCFVITLPIVAVILILMAAVSYPALNKLVKHEIEKSVVLEKGSQLYDVWKGGKVPITFEIYMFNLTNEDEVINNGSKPIVKQIGPFAYKETRVKFNITFNNNGTVSYRENKTFVFDASKSAGPENTTITTINVPLMVALSLVNKLAPNSTVVKDILEFMHKFFNPEDIFITKSVKDLVWGYNDTILELLVKAAVISDPMVGMLYGQNHTDDGLYTVFTGKTDTAKLGVINKWNGVSSIDKWPTKWANMINGTDGTLAPPFIVDKHFKAELYSTDICRSVYGTFSKEVPLHGVKLYRFSPPEREYFNATINPTNRGFCSLAGDCWDSGVLNNENCHKIDGVTAPIVSSNPHFLYSAKKYQDAIIGLNPNQSGLTTDIDIEPSTGLVLHASKRLQINININATKASKGYLQKTPTMIYPVMWINETATAGADDTATVRSQLASVTHAHNAQIVVFALGAFLILVAIIVFAIFRKTIMKSEKDNDPLLVQGSPNDDGGMSDDD